MSKNNIFAKRIAKIEVSGIRKIFDLVQDMREAVDFSLGQPHFDVPDEIKAEAIKAIKSGFNKYTVTQGIPELHEKLRVKLSKKYGADIGHTLITAGAAGGLFLAFMTLIDEGDEVIVPDPYFVLYKHLVNVCGGVPVLLDTYPDFRIRKEALQKAITKKTKIILINNPTNPTGIAYTAEEIKTIAKVAKENDLIVVSDEIYEEFTYDFPHESTIKYYDKTILVSGFSKTYAMPGWRMGYAIGQQEIIEKMTTLQQFSFVCAPAPFQKAVAFALDYDMSKYIAEYKHKRDFVWNALKDTFEVVKPQGAFYIFPKVPRGTDTEFVKKAIEHNVLIVPGSACSQHNTHFRLSYAASDENLKKGVQILKNIVRLK